MTTSDRDKKSTQLFGTEKNKQSEAESKHTTLTISAVEKTISADWLSGRTDDELIEIIARVSDELHQRRTRSTQKIAKEETPPEFREVTDIPLDEYRALPKKSGDLPTSDEKTWYVILVSADPDHSPLPLKVMGDVVIGRGTEGAIPDVDLSEYGAETKGISRMHAMLRPLPDQLIVSDLGSTNGTQVNGERLSLGKPQAVKDKSVISLGQLHFQVHIKRQPEKSKGKDTDKKA